MRPLGQFIYILALATILLCQQILSQAQSPTPPSTTSPAASNTKLNADGLASGFGGGEPCSDHRHVIAGSLWADRRNQC
jgi:hypothetical protein